MTCPFILPPPEIASRLPLLQTPYKMSDAESDPMRELEIYLSLDTAECSRLVSVYFSKLHGSLPILDALNFSEAKSPKLLVGAMVAASTYSEGLKYHAKLTSLVINALFSSLLPCVVCFTSPLPLPTFLTLDLAGTAQSCPDKTARLEFDLT